MQLAPDFELCDDTGNIVCLSEFRGKNWVVLFFYPRDGTPVCSIEVCAFREKYDIFVQAGAVMFGVSSNSVEEHRNFRQRLRLPFKLLSDENGHVRESYGVPRMLGLIPGRGTYIINHEGVLQYSFLGQFDPCKHADMALKIILQNSPDAIVAGNPYCNVLLPALRHAAKSFISRPRYHKSELATFIKEGR